MTFRERPHEDRERRPPEEPVGGDGSRGEGLREAGEAFFQAADEAINRALSGDSLAFLNATRQAGGE